MIVISTSLTMRGKPSPRFHVKAWLPFRNCEMYHSSNKLQRKGRVRIYQNKLGATGERNSTYVPIDILAPTFKKVKRILK